MRYLFVVAVALLIAAQGAVAEPITVKVKDAVRIKGANANPLMGYGLVIGLPGTGDSGSALQTERMTANLLRAAGIRLDDQKLRMRNVAAVMVTASLPAHAQAGDSLDVLVSSMGDARSLRGGTLLMTRLEAADGTCYAVAQGPLSTGGGESGGGVARLREPAVAAGRIPGAALVLRDMTSEVARDGRMTLVLKDPDYATAERLKDLVLAQGGAARVLSPACVEVTLATGGESTMMARMGDLDLQVDVPARVVFNERTGTVVMGGNVRISPVAVSHGALKVNVAAGAVSQAVHHDSTSRSMAVVGAPGATLQDLVDALNDLGATPAEMMQVLQALKQAGALKADLEIQ